MLKGLLDVPILYLSSYIIQNKADYYRLLQEVRTEKKMEEWILYMLDGVEKTSQATITLIEDIDKLMYATKLKLRKELPKIYSKDLVEILFMHPFKNSKFFINQELFAILKKGI